MNLLRKPRYSSTAILQSLGQVGDIAFIETESKFYKLTLSGPEAINPDYPEVVVSVLDLTSNEPASPLPTDYYFNTKEGYTSSTNQYVIPDTAYKLVRGIWEDTGYPEGAYFYNSANDTIYQVSSPTLLTAPVPGFLDLSTVDVLPVGEVPLDSEIDEAVEGAINNFSFYNDQSVFFSNEYGSRHITDRVVATSQRLVLGKLAIEFGIASLSGTTTIAFSTPFSSNPVITVTPRVSNFLLDRFIVSVIPGTSSFQASLILAARNLLTNGNISWIAIGQI